MRRHELDPVSLTFGFAFTGLGLLFLLGRADEAFRLRWIWPILLLVLGVGILADLARHRDRDAEPVRQRDQDEELERQRAEEPRPQRAMGLDSEGDEGLGPEGNGGLDPEEDERGLRREEDEGLRREGAVDNRGHPL